MERLRQLVYHDRARASREMGELSRELPPATANRLDLLLSTSPAPEQGLQYFARLHERHPSWFQRLTRSTSGPALLDRGVQLQPFPFRRNSAPPRVGRSAPRIGQPAAGAHRRADARNARSRAASGPAAAARIRPLPPPPVVAHPDSRRAGLGHAAGNHRRAHRASRHHCRNGLRPNPPAVGRRMRSAADPHRRGIALLRDRAGQNGRQ